jgi:AraC-like DNA-binding protein/mannose-6-phosphate isomerase-like protein (cupin superfamily)
MIIVHNLMIMKTPWNQFADHLDAFYIERAYHYTCREPLFGKLHHHESRFHIAYIITGQCRIEIESGKFPVSPGDAVFIRPKQLHCSIGDTKTYYELIEIHFLVKSDREAKFLPPLRPVVHVHNVAAFVPALERLVAAHLIDASPQNWLTKVRLAETLMLLEKESASLALDDKVAGDMELKMNQAREYISIHYAQNISLDTLCELVGMSASHFATSFKKTTGTSPIEFVIQRRMYHARELLLNSNFSVGQIADMCGFASSQYFSRLFARREGASPGHFRMRKG